MRANVILSGLSLMLLALGGCYSTGPEIKPRTQEEIWTLPPADDKRYCEPPVYPKDPANDDSLKKSTKDPAGMRGGGNRFGGPGGGGPGY
jgi:hypothetical protein